MYTEKELDRLFMMLSDLDKDKKPGFFTHPQYKDLYNHPNRFLLLSYYNLFLDSVKNMNETTRQTKVIELANLAFKNQILRSYPI